jgi:hypothetical protein
MPRALGGPASVANVMVCLLGALGPAGVTVSRRRRPARPAGTGKVRLASRRSSWAWIALDGMLPGMADAGPSPAVVRIRVALDLFEVGVSMKRAQLRRQAPTATAAEIESRLAEWLETRPDAKDGDAWGRAVRPSDWSSP